MQKLRVIVIGLLFVFIQIPLVFGISEQLTCPLQYNDIEWDQTYGGEEFDMFHCVHQTDDEGYIVSGVTEISDRYYPLLMKLDSEGTEEWMWMIQEIAYDGVVYDILDVYPIFSNQVTDGGYLFCLWLDINYLQQTLTIAGLFKFNMYGEHEWTAFYADGFDWIFRPISFKEIEEGYVLAGTSGHPSSYMGEEAGLLLTDKKGNQQWYKEYDYGDEDNNRMEAVSQTKDGGFILTGWMTEMSTDYWMIKTDAYGNKIWDKTFGGDGDDYGHSKHCYQTDDDGYIIGGFSSSIGAGGFDVWIIKTDSMGTMIWDKTYGGTKNDVCWGITDTDDEGYVAVVTMNYGGFFGDKDDIHLVKIDGNGHIEWVQSYGGPGIQLGGSVDATADGGFIVSGCTGSFHSAKSDGLLVKFSGLDNQRPNKPEPPDGPARGKPDTDYTFTTSSSDPDGDSLKYVWDWGDGNFSELLDSNEASYAWAYKDEFAVRVMAVDTHGGESDWSDPLFVTMHKSRLGNMNQIIIWRFIERYPLLKHLFFMDDDWEYQ
jgi:hypothetical protein